MIKCLTCGWELRDNVSSFCSDECLLEYNTYTVKGEIIEEIEVHYFMQFNYDKDALYTLKRTGKVGGLSHAFLENI